MKSGQKPAFFVQLSVPKSPHTAGFSLSTLSRQDAPPTAVRMGTALTKLPCQAAQHCMRLCEERCKSGI